MMKKYAGILVCALLLLVCCDKKDGDYLRTETVTVASETRLAHGEGLYTYHPARYGDSGSWDLRLGTIQGFDFEAGYECVLRIRVYRIPGADRIQDLPFDCRYVLDKVISRTLKNSEGLPPDAEL